MQRFFRPSLINILLVIALFGLTASSFFAYQQIQNLLEANRWVVHTYEVKENISQLKLGLATSVTRVYDYLILNNQNNLRDLPIILNGIRIDFLELKHLTADNLQQQKNLALLEPEINKTIILLEDLIKMHKQKGGAAALNPTYRAQLLDQVTKIKTELTTIRDRENILLKNRITASEFDAQLSLVMVILAGILSDILLILNFYFLYRSEHQKQDLEQRLKKMIDGSSDLIAAIDLDYKFLIFNKAYESKFKEVFGLQVGVGKDIRKLLHNFFLKKNIIDTWARALRGEEFTVINTFDTGKDNAANTYEATFSPIFDANYNLVGAAHIMHDVTQRQRVENLKTEFVSIVSHELRTPLTSILGSLGLLTSGVMGKLDTKTSNMLGIAYSNCQRLVTLINNMLDIEKIEQGKTNFSLQPVDLNKIADETVIANEAYAKTFNVYLHVHKSPYPLLVSVDVDRLIQVLTNLISNAVKFSPMGSRIEVRVVEHDHKARLEVIDKGEGVPHEFRKFIFGKFSQADSSAIRKHGGSGLGLSISKAIIDKLHGEINYFPNKDEAGTTFYIELPLITMKSEVEDISSVNKKEATKKQVKILYVEDDSDLSKIISGILYNEAEVVNVTSKEDALHELSKQQFDLILLDLKLPDGSGIELLPELKRDTPVIVFTAYELPKQYTNYVSSTLIKSKTSNQKLLETIRLALHNKPFVTH